MSQRRQDSKNSDKRSRLDRHKPSKRLTLSSKDRIHTNKSLSESVNEVKKPKSKITAKTYAVVGSVFLSSAVLIGSTTANAAGLTGALDFLNKATAAMDNLFVAGSLMALGGELSNSMMMQNNNKSAERLAMATNAIHQVNAVRESVQKFSPSNIPNSMKCVALYNNKYTQLQNLISQEYTYQQMSLATSQYSKSSSEAISENTARNLRDYCSVDETAMTLCTFTPDGTDALSQDYSHIKDNVNLDYIGATAAEDFATNLVIAAQTDYAQNCDTLDCEAIRNVERRYTAIASMVHGSILGQINASRVLEYVPLRDYVNENMGINTDSGLSSTPTAPDNPTPVIDTAADGTKTATYAYSDGRVKIETTTAKGVVTSITTDKDGKIVARAPVLPAVVTTAPDGTITSVTNNADGTTTTITTKPDKTVTTVIKDSKGIVVTAPSNSSNPKTDGGAKSVEKINEAARNASGLDDKKKVATTDKDKSNGKNSSEKPKT